MVIIEMSGNLTLPKRVQTDPSTAGAPVFFSLLRLAEKISATLARRIARRRWPHSAHHTTQIPIYRSRIQATNFSGGVAEWLIAPVLKTGRPKGLVSSNLTPSASSTVDR